MAPKKEKVPPPSSKPAKSGGGKQRKKVLKCHFRVGYYVVARLRVLQQEKPENGWKHLIKQNNRLVPHNGPVINYAKPVANVKWKRVVFKVSGTALAGSGQSIDPKVALQIAEEVATASRCGVEVTIIIGGRNFFCGDSWVTATDLDRPTAYQISMMATVMNSILLQSALEKLGIQTRVQSAFVMPKVAEPYNRLRAMRHLDKGRVVIFGGVGAGTGNPLFTTDTAAALRASEINADVVIKGTNVNGICDKNNFTVEQISFRDAVSRDCNTMDLMAIQFCEENAIPEATPKSVLRLMGLKGLTLYHLKSHLQGVDHLLQLLRNQEDELLEARDKYLDLKTAATQEKEASRKEMADLVERVEEEKKLMAEEAQNSATISVVEAMYDMAKEAAVVGCSLPSWDIKGWAQMMGKTEDEEPVGDKVVVDAEKKVGDGGSGGGDGVPMGDEGDLTA